MVTQRLCESTMATPSTLLPLDPNDGAGFWWANGKNSFTRNVACENDEYGYRFDIQKRSNFDPVLPVRQPDGTLKEVDVRTMPVVLAAAQGGMGQWAWPRIAAVYVIVVTPGLIAFTFAQKLFFKGLSEGVVKG